MTTATARYVVRQYDDEWYGVWDAAEEMFVFPLFRTKKGAKNRVAKLNASVLVPDEDPAYLAYCEATEAEEEARVAAGGRTICPKCSNRSVVTTARETRNYGGGWDTFEKCETAGCDYAEVSV